MPLYGDKGKVIFANAVARMWQDPEYEKKFLADPKEALREDGIVLPDALEVVLHQNTDKVHYVKLPYRTDLAEAVADIQARAPYIALIPEGHEIRLVRDTQAHVHVILPHKPEGFDPSSMSHDALAAAVVAFDVNVNVNDNANVNANVNTGVNGNVGAVDIGVVVVVT
jgi:hypothetical protein